MNWRAFVALFVLVGAATAVPTSRLTDYVNKEIKCSNPSANLFNEIGKTYVFEYETRNEMSTEQQKDSADQSITMKGTFELTTIAACQHVMRLRDVQMTPESPLSTNVARSPIFFHQDGGRIRHIAHDANEDQQSLNIKRALLSSLQVASWSDVDMDEKDVYGRCLTTYKRESSSGDRVQLLKTKKIDQCSQRRHPIVSLLWKRQQFTPTLTCHMVLDAKQQLIKKSTCVERSEVTVLQQTSLKSQVHSELKVKHVRSFFAEPIDREQFEQFVRADIAYQAPKDAYKHVQTVEQQSQLTKVAIDLLRELHSHQEHKETAEHLDRLSEVIALLSAESIASIDRQLFDTKNEENKDKQRVHRLFGDLLAQSESEAALYYMFDQALKAQHPIRRSFWLLQLGSISNAQPQTIRQLLPLVKSPQTPRQALFAIARVIAASKMAIQRDSLWTEAAERFVERFETMSDEHDKIAAVYALKTIGMTEEHAVRLLKKTMYNRVATNLQSKIEMQTAVLNAITAQPQLVSPKVAASLYELYEQRDRFGAEVRIQVFRALMQSPKHAEQVLRQLHTESNEQVGYYIASYIRDAKAHHYKLSEVSAEVHRLLEQTQVPPAFEAVNLSTEQKSIKTSRHLSFGRVFELFDSELGLVSDVIVNENQKTAEMRFKLYSEKRYADGEHYELRIRQHGVDRMADMLLQQIQSADNSKWMKQAFDLIRSGRSTESLRAIFEPFLKQLLKHENEVYVSIEVSHNQHTLVYVSSHDLLVKSDNQNDFESKPMFAYQSWSELWSLMSDMHFHSLLIRREQLLPTITGVSLRSAVQSSLVASVQIDDRHFRPMFSMSGQVFVGLRVSDKTMGLAQKIRFESSPDFTYEIKRDALGLPTTFSFNMNHERKNTLLRVHSSIERRTLSGRWIEISLPSQQSRHCFDSMRRLTSAQFCFEQHRPTKFSGLWAPIDLHLYVEKDIATKQGWTFELRAPAQYHPFVLFGKRQPILKSHDQKSLHYVIAYRAPSHEKSHQIEVELKNEETEKAVKLHLQSMQHRVQLEARLQNSDLRKAIVIETTLNKITARFDVALNSDLERNTWQPIVRLQLPGQSAFEYDGEFSMKSKGKKDSLKLLLREKHNDRTVVDISLIRSGRVFSRQFQMSLDTTLQPTHFHHIRYSGHWSTLDSGVEFSQQYTYTHGRSAPAVYRMSGKLMNMATKSPLISSSTEPRVQKLIVQIEYALPKQGGEFVWHHERRLEQTTQRIENELSVFHSNGVGSHKERLVYAVQKISIETHHGLVIVAQSSIESERFNLDHSLQSNLRYDSEWRDGQIVFDLARKSNSKSYVQTRFEWSKPKTSLTNPAELMLRLDGEIQTWFGAAKKYALTHSIERKAARYVIKNVAKWGERHTAEWEVIISKNRSTDQLTQYELETQLRVPHLKIEYTVQNVLRTSAHIEFKSLLRDSASVRNEMRLFVSRSQPSSLYVDNRWLNVKLEAQPKERDLQLHVIGKTMPFTHTTRLQQLPSSSHFEFTSKTSANGVAQFDVVVKHTPQLFVFMLQPFGQKLNVHWDRLATKGMLVIGMDKLFTRHTDLLQTGFAFSAESILIESKFERNQTPIGKLRAFYAYNGEASLKMTMGQFKGQLESTGRKNEWTATAEYAPASFTHQTTVKRIAFDHYEGSSKMSYRGRPITTEFVFNWSNDSSFKWTDAAYELRLNANQLKSIADLEFVRKLSEEKYSAKLYTQENSLNVLYSQIKKGMKVHDKHYEMHVSLHRDGRHISLKSPSTWFAQLPLELRAHLKDHRDAAIDHQTTITVTGSKWSAWNKINFESKSKFFGRVYSHHLWFNRSEASLQWQAPTISFSGNAHYAKDNVRLIIRPQFAMWSGEKRSFEYAFEYVPTKVSSWFDVKKSTNVVERLFELEAIKNIESIDLKMKYDTTDLKMIVHPRDLKSIEAMLTYRTLSHLYTHEIKHQLQLAQLIGSVSYQYSIDRQTNKHFLVSFDKSAGKLITKLVAPEFKWNGSFEHDSQHTYTQLSMHRRDELLFQTEMKAKHESNLWNVSFDLNARSKPIMKFSTQHDFTGQDLSKMNVHVLEHSFDVGSSWPKRELNVNAKLPSISHKYDLEVRPTHVHFDVYATSKMVGSFVLNHKQMHLTVYDTMMKIDMDEKPWEARKIEVLLRQLTRDWEAKWTIEQSQRWQQVTHKGLIKMGGQIVMNSNGRYSWTTKSFEHTWIIGSTVTRVAGEWNKVAFLQHSRILASGAEHERFSSKLKFNLDEAKYALTLGLFDEHQWTLVSRWYGEKQMHFAYLYKPTRRDFNAEFKYTYGVYEWQLNETRHEKLHFESIGKFQSDKQIITDFKWWNAQQVHFDFDFVSTSARFHVKDATRTYFMLSTEYRPRFVLNAKYDHFAVSEMQWTVDYRKFNLIGYTSFESKPIQMKMKVTFNPREQYNMDVKVTSTKWQLNHETHFVTFPNSWMQTELATKTESKDFAYEITFDMKNEMAANLLAKYRITSYKGDLTFTLDSKRMIKTAMKYERIGSRLPYGLEATFDITGLPAKSIVNYYRGDKKMEVNILISLKPNQMYEIDMEAKDASNERVWKYTSAMSKDLFTVKSTGLLVGKMSAKLWTKYSSEYSFEYETSNDRKQMQHKFALKLTEEQMYRHLITYEKATSKWNVQLTLPKKHEIHFDLSQRAEDKQQVWIVSLYPNKLHEPTAKYSSEIRYAFNRDQTKRVSIKLEHTSMAKPIEASFELDFNQKQAKPIELRFQIESVVGKFALEKVSDKKIVHLSLYASEKKQFRLIGSWNLAMPRHHQSLVWTLNNDFDQVYEGGYELNADFDLHRYQLQVKNVNQFDVEWIRNSPTEHVLQMQIESGSIRKAYFTLSTSSRIASLKLVDRSDNAYTYAGSADFDMQQGVRVRLSDLHQKREMALLTLKRDHDSFVSFEAKIATQLRREVIKPSASFAQSLFDYSTSKERMQSTLSSIVREMFADRFVTVGRLVARDLYKLISAVLPMEWINDIVGFVPALPEQFVQAIRKLYLHYKQMIKDAFSFHWPIHWFDSLNSIFHRVHQKSYHAYEVLRSSNVTHHTRRLVQLLFDQIAFVQRFFDDHIRESIDLALEQVSWSPNTWTMVRQARRAAVNIRDFVRSFELGELLMNAFEVILGEPVWLKGNSMSWSESDGLLKMRVFVPKGVWTLF